MIAPSTPSSPRTPRRPSMSKPMSWLSRASHSHSPSLASTLSPLHISEPQLVNDLFTTSGGPTYTHSRYGPLGTGATVVRTPQDALARAMLVHQVCPPQEVPGTTDDDVSSYADSDEPVSPTSPPLPPLPYASKSSPELPVPSEFGELHPPRRAKPTRACPAVPGTPPQPPFAPILLSPVPDVLPDPASLIVTLDTSTGTLRTTYGTLTSRPSHLASYLQSLANAAYDREKRTFRDTLVEVDGEDVDDTHSLAAPDTPFASLFTAHLASAGVLPQSTIIHLFLDRPSPPYTHILTYLRSPVATLPRTAVLGPSPHPSRLEALLELRDEAKYLGLVDLHKLCCDELRANSTSPAGNPSAQQPTVAANPNGQQHPAQVLIVPERTRGRDTNLVRLGAILRRDTRISHGLSHGLQHAPAPVLQSIPHGVGDSDRDSRGSYGSSSGSAGGSASASIRSEVARVENVAGGPASPVSPLFGMQRPMSPVAECSGPASSRSHSRELEQGHVRAEVPSQVQVQGGSRSRSRGPMPLRSPDWI